MSAQPVEQRVDPLSAGWVPSVEPVRHLLPVPAPVPDAVTAAVRALVPAPRVEPAVAQVEQAPAPRPLAEQAELRHAALSALRDLARD